MFLPLTQKFLKDRIHRIASLTRLQILARNPEAK